MGILSRLFSRPVEQRSAVDYGPGWGGLATISATNGGVSPQAAENLPTVVACVNAIASGIAALPIRVYRAEGDGRVEAPTHPVARLCRAPNPRQTICDFVEFLMGQVLLWGNALAIVKRDGAGRPSRSAVGVRRRGRAPLRPARIPYCDDRGALMAARPCPGATSKARCSSSATGPTTRLSGAAGPAGRPRCSRRPRASRTYSSHLWRNAATPSGLVSVGSATAAQGPAEFKRFKAQFSAENVGAHNAKRVIFGDPDTKFTPMSVSPEDADNVMVHALRGWSNAELASVRCPTLVLVGDNDFTPVRTRSR